MESIAGSTGRACASGTLGVKFGMVDRINLTLEVSGLPKAGPLDRRVRQWAHFLNKPFSHQNLVLTPG